MKVVPGAWQKAMKLRGFFTSEFLKYHGPTDYSAGICLVETANELGYSKRKRAVPGTTLRNWMQGDSVPQWAVKTMIRYILAKGYIPNTDEELDALMAYLLVDIPDNDISNALLVTGLNNLRTEDVESALGRIVRHA